MPDILKEKLRIQRSIIYLYLKTSFKIREKVRFYNFYLAYYIFNIFINTSINCYSSQKKKYLEIVQLYNLTSLLQNLSLNEVR